MQKKKISDLYPFGLRIPQDLKNRLQVAAESSRISLNAEMVMRLDASFRRPLQEYNDGELVAELMARYGRGEIYIRIGQPSAED